MRANRKPFHQGRPTTIAQGGSGFLPHARTRSTLAHHVQVVCGLSRGRAETWEPTRSWLAQDLEPAIAQQRARNLSQQRRERELFALEAAERVSDAVLR